MCDLNQQAQWAIHCESTDHHGWVNKEYFVVGELCGAKLMTTRGEAGRFLEKAAAHISKWSNGFELEVREILVEERK